MGIVRFDRQTFVLLPDVICYVAIAFKLRARPVPGRFFFVAKTALDNLKVVIDLRVDAQLRLLNDAVRLWLVQLVSLLG